MLRELYLANVKCFGEQHIPLAPLTLLTGTNSSGKSTVLQTLLLLHEGAQLGRWSTRLPLNTPHVTVGSMADFVNQFTRDEECRIGLSFSDGPSDPPNHITWRLAAARSARHERDVRIASAEWFIHFPPHPQRGSSPDHLGPADGFLQYAAGADLFAQLERLRYVPADRMAPAEVHPLPSASPRDTGPRAAGAVGALYLMREEKLWTPELRHPDPTNPDLLLRQVSAWLEDILPGTSLDVQPVLRSNFVTLGLRSRQDGEFVRPQHVGFGVSHLLPVLVSILSARRNDIILLENPESHLHPRAQTRLATLCARAARGGVQIIIESHSDHVATAIRLALRNETLTPDDVALVFFERRDDGIAARRIATTPEGSIGEHPAGFFDEAALQFEQLLSPRAESQ